MIQLNDFTDVKETILHNLGGHKQETNVSHGSIFAPIMF